MSANDEIAAEPLVLLRALIVEDEWIARDYLVQLTERSGRASVVGAVDSFEDAARFLSMRIEASPLDVVFVDVNLVGSEQNGLDLVKVFSGRSDAPAFVLATAMKEHALEAFELGVADYLLKPFTQARVDQCLDRLSHRLAGKPPAAETPGTSRIVARHKRNLVFLDLESVWAFESADRLTLVHADRGSFDIDLSLSTVETTLGRRFLRVHRNWLVRVEHVRELVREGGDPALLVGGAGDTPPLRVPIARERSQALRNLLVGMGIGIRRR